MAEAFDPFASGQAVLVDSPREESDSFDPFASGQAVAVEPPKQQAEAAFDPFAEGRAAAIADTSMVDRLRKRSIITPEHALSEDALGRVEQARIDAINNAEPPTLLTRLKQNIKSGWSNTTIGSLLESLGEPIADEPLEVRRQRFRVDQVVREKARRAGQLGDVFSDPSVVEYTDKMLDSEIDKQGKKLETYLEKFAPAIESNKAQREKALTESAKRIGAYQGLPDYQGPVEGLVALTGQIAGSLPDPANFIGGPEVKALKNTSRIGRVANRFIGEGLGAAAGNLAVEPMSQANRIRTGELDQFSPADAAKGAALGFVAGGIVGAAPEALKRAPKVAEKGPSLVTQMDSSTQGTPTAANVAANEIAMKPIEDVALPDPVVKINEGIRNQDITPDSAFGTQAKEAIGEWANITAFDEASKSDQVKRMQGLTSNRDIFNPIDPTDVIVKKGNKLTANNIERIIDAGIERVDVSGKYSPSEGELAAMDALEDRANQDLPAGPNDPNAVKKMSGALSNWEDLAQMKSGYSIPDHVWNNPDFDQSRFGNQSGVKSNYDLGKAISFVPKALQDDIATRPYKESAGMKKAQEVAMMKPDDFFEFSKPSGEMGITEKAQQAGKGITDPFELEYLQYQAKLANSSIRWAIADGDQDLLRKIMLKEQFFNEAYQAATKSMPFATDAMKAPVEEPVVDAKTYLDELLATKEITPEEHAQQVAALPNAEPAKPIRPIKEAANVMPDFNVITGEYHEAIRAKAKEMGYSDADIAKSKEGFVTPKGEWVSREEAAKLLGSKKRTMTAERMKMEEMKLGATSAAPLVSPPEIQKIADDVEVTKIMNNDGIPPVPPEAPPAQSGDSEYKPFITKAGLGIGLAGRAAKIIAGTIEGNIRGASKRIFGVLRNYEHDKSKLSLQLERMTIPASRLARKVLTKQGNDQVGNLLMSGKIDEAKALVANNTSKGAEFSKAIDDVRAALEQVHALEVQARGEENVPYVKDYFPRQMIDYNDFREFLGKDEQAIADAAISRAQKASETPLTKEQIDSVLNNLISQSRMNGGKPGFLKSRTVKEIDDSISRFYEPWDVALENYLRRATNDIVNRSYFGKAADDANWNPSGGSIGKAIAEEIAAGRLKGAAQNIVIDNLKDRFKAEYQDNSAMAEIGKKIRFAQTAAFLGQLQTGLVQFSDIFGSILHQGPIDTFRGYKNQKTKLQDINVHEGNVETVKFSRDRGSIQKGVDAVLKLSIGLADQFNKQGVANAIREHYAGIVKNPNSDQFKKLNRDYSQKFPEQWPEMLKELQTKKFQDGDVKDLPNAQFFLYNEIADIHPINPSGMSQGFNAAHPLAKPLWGLKSYMIKQLDIMRARGYEKVKDPRTRNEGLAYLAAYAMVVAGAQNFAVSWFRDKLADRETDTSDYFVGGFLQPLGISRYTINTLRKGEVGKAAVETTLPFASLVREGINDLGLTRDMVSGRRDKKTGVKTVADLEALVSQSELIKHFPIVGSLYSSRFGKGAANEQKRREEKAKGRGQPNTVETISDIISPAETSSR